jgi:hypothetical protein
MDWLIDSEGDMWIPHDGGWLCQEYPDCWFPDRDLLDKVWGPLVEEGED